MAYVIKAEIRDPAATTFEFVAQRTMYGGKSIAAGDTMLVFARENERGEGLLFRGAVAAARAAARKRGIARQTPRVSVVIKRPFPERADDGRAPVRALAARRRFRDRPAREDRMMATADADAVAPRHSAVVFGAGSFGATNITCGSPLE